MTDYKFVKSTRKNKKYAVLFTDGRPTVHFGAADMPQYKDSTGLGLWSEYDHGDEERRKSFRARFKSPGPKYSARWFSWHYLW